MRSLKNLVVTKGKDLECTDDVEVFPSQISEAYPSPDWQYGEGRYHAKGCFRPKEFRRVLALWRVAAPSAIKKRTTPLCSSFLASISNAGTNTIYITFTSRAIKKQLCGSVRFPYASLLSYRWQYRYVTTVLPGFPNNVFYGRCSVFT